MTSSSRNEEFEDWPQTLLAIGTLGDNKIKEDISTNEHTKSSQASQYLPNVSPEEIIRLQKELTTLLNQRPEVYNDESERGKEGRNSLSLNGLLNCPLSLEINKTAGRKTNHEDSDNNDDAELSSNARIILTRAKDLLTDNKSGMRKTSLKFLLKKMFVCHGGFAPTPSLRDPIPESRLEKVCIIITVILSFIANNLT